jgi:hypothetical protein
MPTEGTFDSPLSARVTAHYRQLSAAAADLNAVSDELGKSVQELDSALKKLNLGVSVWVTITGSEDENQNYWNDDVGYTKIDGKWGIALRSVSGNLNWDQYKEEAWLFNDAPRSLRLTAIGKIPELLKQLSADAAEMTKQIKGRLAEVQEVASAVKLAAKEVSKK